MKLLITFAAISILIFSRSLGEEPTNWEGKKVPQLVLADGKTYTDVTFKKIYPDAISITHSAGVARIPMEDLKSEARTALGYDPVAAAEARKRDILNQRVIAANQAKRAAEHNLAKAQQHLAEVKEQERAKLKARAKRIYVQVIQVTNRGIIAREGRDSIIFIEIPASSHKFVDNEDITLPAVLMADPYRYETVTGATASIPKWVFVDPTK